jgi:hypothetical protein
MAPIFLPQYSSPSSTLLIPPIILPVIGPQHPTLVSALFSKQLLRGTFEHTQWG